MLNKMLICDASEDGKGQTESKSDNFNIILSIAEIFMVFVSYSSIGTKIERTIAAMWQWQLTAKPVVVTKWWDELVAVEHSKL